MKDIIKKAQELQKTDINEAIRLLELAFSSSKEKYLGLYYKLATLYLKTGQTEKSFAIMEKYISSLDKSQYGMYNMDMKLGIDKICILKYSNTEYKSYLQYFSYWIFHTFTAKACQCLNFQEFKNTFIQTDYLKYLSPSKISYSFEKIDRSSKKNEFNLALKGFFKAHEADYLLIARTASKIFNSNIGYRTNETIGERFNRLAGQNNEFLDSYNRLNGNIFYEYFSNTVEPIIN